MPPLASDECLRLETNELGILLLLPPLCLLLFRTHCQWHLSSITRRFLDEWVWKLDSCEML